jgi:hypothetical protein
VLLLMVLFENSHLGNSRSEGRSVLTLNPLRTLVLLVGTITAFWLHVVAMRTPGLSAVLHAAPVGPGIWAALIALAATAPGRGRDIQAGRATWRATVSKLRAGKGRRYRTEI